MAHLRPYAPTDLPGIYRVCAEVDARGSGERQRLHAPELAGHVFTGPYIAADPGLCWVIADELGVAGYILGTADTAGFEAWRENHWYPALRQQHPRTASRDDGSADDRYLRFIYAAPRAADAVPPGYPAELHIKLDPRAAGRGWGRQLIEALVEELKRRGVTGLHLNVAAENTNAVGFYGRLGFRVFSQTPGGITMVRYIAQ